MALEHEKGTVGVGGMGNELGKFEDEGDDGMGSSEEDGEDGGWSGDRDGARDEVGVKV